MAAGKAGVSPTGARSSAVSPTSPICPRISAPRLPSLNTTNTGLGTAETHRLAGQGQKSEIVGSAGRCPPWLWMTVLPTSPGLRALGLCRHIAPASRRPLPVSPTFPTCVSVSKRPLFVRTRVTLNEGHPKGLIFRSHLHRPCFQIKSQSQTLGLGTPECLLGDTQVNHHNPMQVTAAALKRSLVHPIL